jgi:hypothetical protein
VRNDARPPRRAPSTRAVVRTAGGYAVVDRRQRHRDARPTVSMGRCRARRLRLQRSRGLRDRRCGNSVAANRAGATACRFADSAPRIARRRPRVHASGAQGTARWHRNRQGPIRPCTFRRRARPNRFAQCTAVCTRISDGEADRVLVLVLALAGRGSRPTGQRIAASTASLPTSANCSDASRAYKGLWIMSSACVPTAILCP